MCRQLSFLLRYTTSGNSSHATIKNEIDYTKNFLGLMKFRFGDQFDFNISIPDELNEIKVPKIVLQSFLENCFKHAFNVQEPPWKIDIKGEISAKNWTITICDNGPGFSNETLAEINSGILLKEERNQNFEDNGLGVLNIYNRLKIFMSRLIIKRSWSYCVEMMMYIRYFFEVFYAHEYADGFLERLVRQDIEKYLGWVAGDYEGKNATFRSKAVSFIRQYIDYIQLAEYPQAPKKDVNRLIFEDDIPKCERSADTMGKVKYVPEPVIGQLDACIGEIESVEMMPVYVLLRESGWRGTDVLNLRYDSYLEHLWNGHEKEYIPYLCGEITKTGIPLLKIPIRKEVADMVKT